VRLSVFLKLFVSTVTFPPSDSDCVNRSTSLQQFRLIHIRRARRSRSAMVVTSIRHWIVLCFERYWLAGVGGCGWARSRKSAWKDIGDGGGFSVKICKLSLKQSPCCHLDFCVLLPVRFKIQNSRRSCSELTLEACRRQHARWLSRLRESLPLRDTAIGLGTCRDRGLKVGRANGAIHMYDECCHTVGCHQAVWCKFRVYV